MEFFKKSFSEFQDDYMGMYPEIPLKDSSPVKNITFVLTDACNMACFPAGTKITMADFTLKNIEDVEAGDMVLGYPEFTNEKNPLAFYPTKVVNLFSQKKKNFIKFELENGEEIIATEDHPFRARTGLAGAYREAKKWKIGQELSLVYNEKTSIRRKIVKITPFKEEQLVYNMETESHTYIASNALVHNCSYCYLHNKSQNHLSFEQSKKIIDMLFEDDLRESKYINRYNADALIIEFIGGEPLLEIDLMEQIMRYFRWKAIKLKHRWATKYMISISTNGVLYQSKKVQNFMFKNLGRVSMTITIDGNKELHDACRVFPDGSPSYDIVAASVKQYRKLVCSLHTKLTIAPENVQYLFEAVKNLKEEFDMDGVFANCVYEKGWTTEHAKILYEQLKLISDWILDNDLEGDFFCTLLDNSIGESIPEDNVEVYCGGNARMLSFTNDGNIQPCLRFTKASLGCSVPQVNIGDIENGIGQTEEHKAALRELEAITRKTISTEKCFNCPIASGCAYCVAYNYEVFGTPNSRATFICEMHQARVLANRYYWMKLAGKHNIENTFKLNIPDEWALSIIDSTELEELKKEPS